jgi:abortive infection bacteriophage resistance protein
MQKPFMTYNQQIQKLRDKRMTITDEDHAKEVLHRVSYFALITGYKDIFKDPTTKKYRNGVTFEDVEAIYQFDKQLRELTFRYLLLIEQNLRSVLSYTFCNIFGDNQSAYITPQNYNTSTPDKNTEVSKLINKHLKRFLTQQTQYIYIEHYKNHHGNVPLWVLVNALTFGTLSKMYKYSKSQVQSAVSREFAGINEHQLGQILEVLTNFRNVCAHNERLFSHKCPKNDIPDLSLHTKLSIPKQGQQYVCGKRDYFSVVISMRYLLPKEEFLEYKMILSNLLDKAAKTNAQLPMTELLKMMGFPSNWKMITRFKIV